VKLTPRPRIVVTLKGRPTLAQRCYRLVVEEGRHHTSAVCTLAAVMATRIAACWRPGEHYVLRDVDGREITEAEGRAICAERYKVTAEDRRPARTSTAQELKKRAGRGGKESTKDAPASDPPAENDIPVAGAA
jgi:hypothetical protein